MSKKSLIAGLSASVLGLLSVLPQNAQAGIKVDIYGIAETLPNSNGDFGGLAKVGDPYHAEFVIDDSKPMTLSSYVASPAADGWYCNQGVTPVSLDIGSFHWSANVPLWISMERSFVGEESNYQHFDTIQFAFKDGTEPFSWGSFSQSTNFGYTVLPSIDTKPTLSLRDLVNVGTLTAAECNLDYTRHGAFVLESDPYSFPIEARPTYLGQFSSLTLTEIPEPASCALVAGLGAALAGLRPRKNPAGLGVK